MKRRDQLLKSHPLHVLSFIAVSLLLHAALAFIISLAPRPPARPDPQSTSHEPIEWTETVPPTNGKHPAPTQSSSEEAPETSTKTRHQTARLGQKNHQEPRHSRRQNTPSLKEFLPTFRPPYADVNSEDMTTNSSLSASDPGFASSDSYRMNAQALEQSSDIHGFLEAVYARINNKLFFDYLLSEHGHFGVVFCEFAVEPDGTLLPSFTQTKTVDRILKVHVLRAIRSALTEPLPISLHLPSDMPMTLRAQFQFIAGGSSLYDENPTPIVGRAFIFSRRSLQGKVPKKLLAHLASGGIQLDPFAMHEAWQKYLKHKERRELGTDPFLSYRSDSDY